MLRRFGFSLSAAAGAGSSSGGGAGAGSGKPTSNKSNITPPASVVGADGSRIGGPATTNPNAPKKPQVQQPGGSVGDWLPPIISGKSNKVLGTGDNENQEVLQNRKNALEPDASVLLARQMPRSISSNFGSEERNPVVLAQEEEERRLKRQKYNFDEMIVFEGGAIADHESYGRSMIMRDFVHYGLYHYKWGYVPKMWKKYRQLLTQNFHDPIAFASMRNDTDYRLYVGKQQEASPSYPTPGSIFQPYYGWVVAEYFISIMRSKFDPAEPLVIYDIGCGSGALALSILDFLAEQYPEIYETMEYHCIDMMPYVIPSLRVKLVHHLHHVKIHHISIHNWRDLEPRRCFCVGLELLNSMPHDMVFWTQDGTAYEQWVRFEEKDNLGTGVDRQLPLTDPIILRYLRYTRWMMEDTLHALKVLCVTEGEENIDRPTYRSFEPEVYDSMRVIIQKCLNVHNPYRQMYIPTAAMVMLEVMSKYFPRHHAFFADYRYVQSGVVGLNGPLCQVKLRASKDIFFRRVADHLLQNAGMVDVCFPTDAEMFQQMYKSVCGEHKEISNMTHPDFWRTYGGDKVALFAAHNGFNPILEDFQDFQVFASHHPAEM